MVYLTINNNKVVRDMQCTKTMRYYYCIELGSIVSGTSNI